MGLSYSATVPTEGRQYGWKRGSHDPRDKWHAFRQLSENTAVDLRSRDCMPDIYDQGKLGSCTANAIAACFEYDVKAQEYPDFMPSRLFIYYNERDMEGHVGEDSGAEIRDGMKSVAKQGVCKESEWPYDITKFTEKPTPECYESALKNRSVSYIRVQHDLGKILAVLNYGYPIAFGFTVYESFESAEVAETGEMPMPQPGEEILGGHAVVLVGYIPQTEQFIVRNSWGENWGDEGYFYMPKDFLLDPSACSDFWTINTVIEM